MYHTRMYQLLKFADDAKCFNHIKSVSDKEDLQDNITALFAWSQDNDLNFNIKTKIYSLIIQTQIPHNILNV